MPKPSEHKSAAIRERIEIKNYELGIRNGNVCGHYS